MIARPFSTPVQWRGTAIADAFAKLAADLQEQAKTPPTTSGELERALVNRVALLDEQIEETLAALEAARTPNPVERTHR